MIKTIPLLGIGTGLGIIGHQIRPPIKLYFESTTARLASYAIGFLMCVGLGAFMVLALGGTREDSARFIVASLLSGGAVGAGVSAASYLQPDK